MKRIWFVVPLLVALVVGMSLAGCVGPGSSPGMTGTPQASGGSGSTPTPTPTPNPYSPWIVTINGTKMVLAGFNISVKLTKVVIKLSNGTVWSWPPYKSEGEVPLAFEPLIVLKNGTKHPAFMNWYVAKKITIKNGKRCVIYAKLQYFWVDIYNKTVKNPFNTSQSLPFYGNTTFYFSSVWNKTTFYGKVLPMLKNSTKIEFLAGPISSEYLDWNFTNAVKYLEHTKTPVFLMINWSGGSAEFNGKLSWNTTGESSTTGELLNVTFTYYLVIKITPYYVPYGQYPPKIYPWQIPGNDYVKP